MRSKCEHRKNPHQLPNLRSVGTRERGAAFSAALMSALLSSSSRAISTWPLWAEQIKAVLPSCPNKGQVVFVTHVCVQSENIQT
jgi:hypothetical protein